MRKGHKKHKCLGCGTNRSTAGDYCVACIQKHLSNRAQKVEGN